MKLFTEKQVIKAIKLARECNSDCWGIDFYNGTTAEILDLLTPIELPSDEEIQDGMAKTLFVSTDPKHKLFNTGTRAGFNNGAKWVIEHIKQQDNGTKKNGEESSN